MYPELLKLVRCPRCGAAEEQGLDLTRSVCNRCEAQFFDLDGLPCWFPAGQLQQELWQDLFAKFLEQADLTRESHLADMGDPGLLLASQNRVGELLNLRMGTFTAISGLLAEGGLQPKKAAAFAHFTPESFAQYYELMLRDWAWNKLPHSGDYREYEDENALALASVMRVIKDATVPLPRRILVLGSGAGRLSWDMHCALNAELTVALDQHPLLIYLSHKLVRQNRHFVLPDTRKLPRDGLPHRVEWNLACASGTPQQRASWLPFAGDAWALPFAQSSFDLVVTPWFIDITGRDIKTLLPVVEHMLKPGGCWLNYGPLLYSDQLPESQRYTFAELRELLKLASFDVLAEEFNRVPYTYSPLSERGRMEEVWTFLARSAANRDHLHQGGEWSGFVKKTDPPVWWILPHLPIPRFTQPDLFPESLQNISRLIDGTRSIQKLAELLAPNLPQGQDPQAFVYDFLAEYVVR
jgi:hypothetical protein